MNIGTFTKDDKGNISGVLRTLTMEQSITFEPLDLSADKAPDYRAIVSNTDTEIGAGWKKETDKGKQYLSISLDDPSFSGPIYCRLSSSSHGNYALWFERSSKRKAEF